MLIDLERLLSSSKVTPDRWAILSPDARYRYALGRWISPTRARKRVLFCMLNPSTADHVQDDPTIRRCTGFADRLEASELWVVNLYALRATDPKELWRTPDAERNDGEALRHQSCLARVADVVIAAWGAFPLASARAAEFGAFVRHALGKPLYCLGTSRAGFPRHPLMLANSAELVEYPSQATGGNP